MNNLKAHLGHFLGTVTSSAGALTAWQTHVDWLMRVGASAVAILAGLLTIRSLLRKK